jgi:hypothetical protein
MLSSADYSNQHQTMILSSSVLYKHQLWTRYFRNVFRILSESHKISSFIHFSSHLFSSSHSFIWHHYQMIVFSSLFEIYVSFSSIALLFEWSIRDFMNEDISKQIKKVNFQIRDFLRTNHKFDDLVFVDIKNFISNIIKDKNSSITLKSRKTRFSKSSNNITWSQAWAIDRDEFKKVIVNFEKAVDLSFNFSKDHSRESFKDFISFAIELFAISRLILSVLFSLLTRISTNIANQIVSARDSSFLTSVSSDFENSSNVRSFSKFDFTSRFYETSQKANLVFVISKKNSSSTSLEINRTNSILEFIENSKQSTIAQSIVRDIVDSARSISILQFVLHSKSADLNSKSTFFEQFSSKSTTFKFDKQTARTIVKYEISRNTSAIETHFFFVSIASSMTQEFNETQKRELMTMMQKFWVQRSAASASQQA